VAIEDKSSMLQIKCENRHEAIERAACPAARRTGMVKTLCRIGGEPSSNAIRATSKLPPYFQKPSCGAPSYRKNANIERPLPGKNVLENGSRAFTSSLPRDERKSVYRGSGVLT